MASISPRYSTPTTRQSLGLLPATDSQQVQQEVIDFENLIDRRGKKGAKYVVMEKLINVSLTLIFFLAISLLGIGEASATQLKVALYPYVPRLEQFQTAIQAEWDLVEPNVPLNFVPSEDWDGGYSKNPPEDADVYVFDAMFFDYFRNQNWLEPIQASEIKNLEDFVEQIL
ncbi:MULTISPECIES: hypothetical protein [unclassified Moorena]|uniref:hypothetical protein n=1 Tax=unclassified Moorena TaxID=2683338 RepID=UPI0025DDD03F|nr:MULTISPECIES: hypothetical protein [unclassified Moorena]